MTKKQVEQWNKMRNALIAIAKGYDTPSKLRKNAERDYGLDYEDVLEMAYENIQQVALIAIKGTRGL